MEKAYTKRNDTLQGDEDLRNILIVDDDRDLAEITATMLAQYGYGTRTAESCNQAYDLLKKYSPDLIILDINLPDGSGFEVCQELRRISEVPVVFASARIQEDDKITGFDLGGDDYLEKPYSLKELLSRVNAIMRRTYGKDQNEEICLFGIQKELQLYPQLRKVMRKDEEIKLSLKEFDLLCYLCRHAGKPLSKEEILRDVWGAFSETEPSTLAVHIRWLREKLERDPSNPELIQTVWGVGYRLAQEDGAL